MLPVSAVEIVPAPRLVYGDLAYLHVLERLVLVGNINDRVVSVVLDQENKWEASPIDQLSGYATRISGWEIEVDPLEVDELDYSDSRTLCLSVSPKGLSIMATPPSKFGHIVVQFADRKGPEESNFLFKSWRLLHQLPDRTEVLFQRKPSTG